MKILLTGFEPFDTSTLNPSEQVVRVLSKEKIDGIELCPAILPVDRVRGPQMLIDAFTSTRPDVVLCLGEASRRMAISVERVAVNLLDFRIADNAGTKVTDEPIVPGASAAYFATLPVRAMCESIRAAGVPCELSLSAGAFLCNQVMYTMLHHIAQNRLNTPAGFVHLPRLPKQIAASDIIAPSMELETMLTGIRAALETVGQIGNLPHILWSKND